MGRIGYIIVHYYQSIEEETMELSQKTKDSLIQRVFEINPLYVCYNVSTYVFVFQLTLILYKTTLLPFILNSVVSSGQVVCSIYSAD